MGTFEQEGDRASPPSKKRKPAKIGCSSFEEAQHPAVSDGIVSLVSLCLVSRSCLLLVGVFSADTLSCGSGAAHLWL